MNPKNCMIYINHHNLNGGSFPEVNLPKSFNNLVQHVGTAEDSSGIFQGFEKYLTKLLKVMSD